ncbi:MAG: DoxX family protein [Catenulispora sp.]|nr:DoxX family protein [Catenulispora sp.]
MPDLRSLPPIGLSLYRIVIGFLMACHGASSLTGWPAKPVGGHTVTPTTWPGGVAAVLQLVFGVLVLLGLGTRISAVILSGTMAYAYFDVHQKHALLPISNGGEPAALFSWSFLVIAIVGAGPLALDALLPALRSGRADEAAGPALVPATSNATAAGLE